MRVQALAQPPQVIPTSKVTTDDMVFSKKLLGKRRNVETMKKLLGFRRYQQQKREKVA